MKLQLALLIFLAAATMNGTAQTQPADVIFLHGNIYTGATQRGDKVVRATPPSAQAIAIRGDRIVAVGSDHDIEKLKGKQTKVVDFGGHFVMPGFNDAHTHLGSGGFEKLDVNLVGTKSLDEMKSRIAARVRTAAPGEWIVGRGWDHTLWSDQKLPTRQDLDPITQNHPAVFIRVDGHISVVNSAALQAAGITRTTPDPPGGKIDRDANGEPTGILREKARDLVESKIPPPSPSLRRRAAELALQEAAQSGITSAQDFSAWEDFLTYEDMENEGKLTLRISEWLPFEQPLNVLDAHRAHHPAQDPMLHTGMLKGFMDGSLGSRTAALLQPYSDDPANKGIPQYDQQKLNDMIGPRVAAGFQIGFHAIGDGGVEMALQAFSVALRYVRERNVRPNDDFRFRVEHAQVLAPDQFARFRDMKVIASMQPNHLLTDMKWAMSRIGPQRAKYSYAWAQFLHDSVMLAFGTDYPVEPITPFRGLYAAVTRKNEAGTAEYFPEQKLTIEEAIAAYTTGAAYAEFAEHDKGLLAPGMLADFVVLDRDLTKVTPAEILHTRVLRTVVGGNTVYEAK
ncbi:MAG TPA: amidohydrolase [Terriglobales bacterium]|nr:amidohydrolase [Terriglobales bacterium]